MSTLVQSKHYYNEPEGTYTFRVEDTIFKLHSVVLRSASAVFADMFTLPVPAENAEFSIDGLSEDKPITLCQVAAQDFDYLCNFLYLHKTWIAPPYDLQFLIAVLELSQRWEITSGEQWATHYLKTIVDTIKPALRFRLARIYNFPEWVRPAFALLMFRSLWDLKRCDREWLGYEAYTILAQAQEKVRNIRLKLAFIPPDISKVRSDDCSENKHHQCVAAWKEAWIMHMGRQLCHPSHIFALKMHEAEEEIRKLRVKGMNGSCLDVAMTMAAEMTGFSVEGKLMDAAVCALSEVQFDRHEAVSLENGQK